MTFSDVVLTILAALVVAALVAVRLIKWYVKTWLPELIKAEVRRQYSLSEESAGDRLSACRSLLLILDETRVDFVHAKMGASLVLACALSEEPHATSLANHLLYTMLKETKPKTLLNGVLLPPLDQAIIAAHASLSSCSKSLEDKVRLLRAWLPDNVESLVDSIINVYRAKPGLKLFGELTEKARKEKLATSPEIVKGLVDLFDETIADRDKLETQLKTELKRLLGVETPRKPVV